MHTPVIFVDFGGVGFRSEPGEAFFENIDSQRFIRSDQNVNSKIEFVSVDQ